MSKFKRKGKGGTPAISTASLPDIVFMLLFFFMVTTTMREVDLKVKNTKPNATEIQKLERKSLVSYIYVGAPKDRLATQFGTEPRIQLNDAFAKLTDISQWVETEREARNEAERPLLTISIKADKKVKMGLISDLKQELRKAQALKINYSATPGEIFGGKKK
jgi:biopolymer transport protein ExbD